MNFTLLIKVMGVGGRCTMLQPRGKKKKNNIHSNYSIWLLQKISRQCRQSVSKMLINFPIRKITQDRFKDTQCAIEKNRHITHHPAVENR